uniref:HTH_Tnp_Tc3_2 domain-containing protein n=1 Tax=Heterorhabditis bacteriophora TaxID=37862 RepID=A0A1I7WZ92_HETBA
MLKICVTRMALQRTVKRYQELGTVEDHPRSGRPRSVNTSRIRKIVKKRIFRDNKRLMRKLASDLGISPTSMRRIVKHELGFCSHKILNCYEKRNSIDDNRKMGHSNRTGHLVIRPKPLSSCADSSFQTFEAKTFGHQIHLISIQWTLQYGQSWKISRVEHPTTIWTLLRWP